MDLIADVFDGGMVAYDECLAEVGYFPFPKERLVRFPRIIIFVPTVWCISAAVAIRASISRPHPGYQGQARSSSPPCPVLAPICRGSQEKQSRFCYTRTSW